MKILHIASECNGGVLSFIENLSLNISDDQITLLTFGSIDKISELAKNKIKIIHIPYRIYSIKAFFILFRAINQAEVVHVHLFPMLYICSVLKSFFRGKTFIYTEHASLNNRRKIKQLRNIERIIYRNYDKVVGVSESCSEALRAWIGPMDNIVTIYNGVDLNLTRQQSLQNIDFRPYTNYTITMVARLSSDKDFKTLLQSFTLLDNNYHLYLVGEGDLRKTIQDMIIKYELVDKVSLLGYRSDVPAILRQSDLSVLSSYGEGFGLAIIESLAVGTICLGSHVSGIKDILDSEYLFELGDSKTLAEKIMKYCNLDLSEKCKNMVKEYDVNKMVQLYKKVYNNAIQ